MSSPTELERFAPALRAGFPMKDVRWVFPTASARAVTLWGGRTAFAWYDVVERGWARMDEEGIEKAARAVAAVIEEERRRGVPSERIVLAGFSQGGALALHAGLCHSLAVGGIIALSAAVPLCGAVPAARPNSPPVFLAHGVVDTVLPFYYGWCSDRLLRAKGYRVQSRRYATGHWVTRGELADVARWLEGQVLSRPDADTSAAGPGKSTWPTIPFRKLGQVNQGL
jgi:phospholipase/carboxylesterase